MSKRNKIAIIIVTVLLILINIFILDKDKKNMGTVEVKTVETQGEAQMGGEFSLITNKGQMFTQENLKGKYSIIYFGFTNCPMICPTALNSISYALTQLEYATPLFQPIIITTDPERDTSERLTEYLSSFHPQFIGLTGSAEELKKAQEAFKVYAEKIPGQGENYDMNHSSIIYVMDREGRYLTHFNHETPPEEMVTKLKELVKI